MKLPCSHFAHSDTNAELHGSREVPIPVLEKRALLAAKPLPYIKWEYDYVCELIGKNTRCHQGLLSVDRKFVDRIVFHKANGLHHIFYFDVHEQVLALGNAIEAAR